MLRMLIGAGVVLGMLAPHSAMSRTLEQSVAGPWAIAANGDDTSGAFTRCTATSEPRNGVGLLLAVDAAQTWKMGFSGQLGVRAGESHPVQYRVDTGPVRSAPATATASDQVEVPIEDAADFLQELRKGRRLIADGGNERLTFGLRGTQAMLSDLLGCVQRWSSRSGGTGIADAGATQAQPRVPSTAAERRLEAMTVAVNILSRAQLVGFELQPEGISPRFAGHDVTWRVQNVTGSLRLVGLEGGDVIGKIRADLTSSDMQACRERFNAESVPEPDGRSASLFTQCQGEKGWAVNYLVITRPTGGAFVLTMTSDVAKADALRSMAETLRSVALPISQPRAIQTPSRGP